MSFFRFLRAPRHSGAGSPPAPTLSSSPALPAPSGGAAPYTGGGGLHQKQGAGPAPRWLIPARRSVQAVGTATLVSAAAAVSLQAAPVIYDFNSGLPLGLTLAGHAKPVESGGPDGSGYLSLTDALGSQAGGVRFPGPVGHVDQFRLRFKARIADGTAADGFSLTVAPDLPLNTAGNENGHKPGQPGRLIVSFDTYQNGPADFIGISVTVDGRVVKEIRTGTEEIPSFRSDFGDWTEFDIHLERSGRLSLGYGGVVVLDRFQTGYEGLDHAWIGLDARTGSNFDAHWFDDLSLDLTEGDGGPLALSAESELSSLTTPEAVPVRLAAVPAGTGPFSYQWKRNGSVLEGQTRRTLHLSGALAEAGDYSVTVTDAASQQITSPPATLTVTPDTAAPRLLGIRAAAGTVNRVFLTFDELLDATTAASCTVPGLTVLSSTLTADGKGVVLQTSPQAEGQSYQVSVTGLKDRAAAGNAHTGTHAVTARADYREEVLADQPTRYFTFGSPAGSTPILSDTSIVPPPNGDSALLGIALQGGELDGETPSLLTNRPDDRAAGLNSASGHWFLVPNGPDINSAGPYARKTVEFWIRPGVLPSFEITGTDQASIWEQGGADRGLNVYLWRNPESTDPDTVSLVFHAYNRLADGPGAPFGLSASPAVFVEHPGIRSGETYHVAAVLDGGSTGPSGQLLLYVNGRLAGRAPDAGRIYSHTSDVRLGHGNGRLHTDYSGVHNPFDGVLDEVALYNTALSPDRAAAHYAAGSGTSGSGGIAIGPDSDLADRTTDENVPAVFSVSPEGNGPFTYQWLHNGAALAGETTRELRLSGRLAQAGSYTVTISNGATTVTTPPAVLTVTADTTPAAITSAEALGGILNQVLLAFSEPVDAASAGLPSTWNIPGLTVLSVTVAEDGLSATLLTSTQDNGKSYQVSATGLRDRSQAGNAAALTVPFISRWGYRQEVLADHPSRYWQFNEGAGTTAVSQGGILDVTPAKLTATFNFGEFTATPSLLPADPDGFALTLQSAFTQHLKVANGSDLNEVKGPWSEKTIEFWFNAASLPAVGTDGLAATAGLWEQGGTSRGIAVYLWRNPADENPETASLVFHAFNDLADGPGAPFGINANPPVFVEVPGITARQTYHVAAVFDGDPAGTTGELILYVNGEEAGRAAGVGQIYNHTGDIQIGQGNTRTHTLINGNLLTFDGIIDEVAAYSATLPAQRIAAHYQTGTTEAASSTGPVIRNVEVRDGQAVISWSGGGQLQRSESPAGPWTDLTGAVSPYADSVLSSGRAFYRLIVR